MRQGEAGLPRASVINVTQLRTVDRDRLAGRIGALDPDRVCEVLRGIAVVFGLDQRHLPDE